MIFLRSHKLVFLKARKVAGTSFEIALSRYAQPSDIVTPISEADELIRRRMGFSGPINHLGDDGKLVFRNHMTAMDVRKRLGDAEWSSACKVAIVRNPFDVYVSLYYYRNGSEADVSNISDWYLKGDGLRLMGLNAQQYFIDGRVVLDKFIRYENFKDDILGLEQDIPGLSGLYETFSQINAKSGIRPAFSKNLADIYAGQDALVDKISSLHGFEIERFCYSPQ